VRVSAGASQQLIATPMDAHGNVLSGGTVSWRSTSAGASVTSAGRLTAATLVGAYGPSAEATAVHIGVSAQATVNVIVVPAELTQVVLGPTAVELGRGMTQQFVVAAGDRFGNRIADAAFQWSVTDGGSIDDSGLYTAGDVPGEYDVKVSVGTGDDATTVIAKVTVLPERISFFSDREDDQLEIYIMDLDGSNVRRLTEAPTAKFLYSWSSDGRRLAYDQLASARASC
jgi:hypothetical protein